jgi:hypothetical protein
MRTFALSLLILPLGVGCLAVTIETLSQKRESLANKADILLVPQCFL